MGRVGIYVKKALNNERKQKQVKVTHVHHKPYRKRHLALLIASIALGLALVNSVILYFNNAAIGRRFASETIASLFGESTINSTSTITSKYGFALSYDANRYYASAIDTTSGDLFVGDELSASRAYNTIRLSSQRGNVRDGGSFKATYYQTDTTPMAVADVEQQYVVKKQASQAQLQKIQTEKKTYGGVEFQRTEWGRTLDQNDIKLAIHFVTYSGVVNGSPLVAVALQGANGVDSEAVMSSFSVSTRLQAQKTMPQTVAYRYERSLSVIDSLLGVKTAAAAASAPNYTTAERISASYGPAVVKVYNIIVGDLAIDGRVVLPSHVAGGTGSGFIVSSDGYIATNGHVAVANPRDELLMYAVNAFQQGNETPFRALITVSGTTNADVAGAKDAEEVFRIIVEKLYSQPENRFTFVNAQQNMLVGLGEKQVDIESLLQDTKQHRSYSEESTIKKAELISSDYDGTILPTVTGKFSKSDVALIKIDGSNYPMVKLGDMSAVSQGGNLNIMGYPGIGSSNGIVSETKTAATLTTGKISSKKSDTGNHNLVETDTEIGHGNSGGPAFSDSGEVIGIATYAVDPGGKGDGVLNYVRDIEDFKNIAQKESVNFTISATQKTWDTAIEQFYTARYKKAVVNFAKVKELYPDHPRVAELTGVAEKRIANGENIDDFPVVPAIIGSVITLIGVGVSVWFIVAHRKGHNALVQGVALGQVQPMTPGMPPQAIPAATPPAQLFAQPPQPASSVNFAPTQSAAPAQTEQQIPASGILTAQPPAEGQATPPTNTFPQA